MSAAYFDAFPTIRYEGPDSTSDLAYRWYDKDRVVFGKRMEDYLRFAVCMWHTFCWPGSDVFGAGTFDRPWLTGAQDEAAARAKREAALAFVEKPASSGWGSKTFTNSSNNRSLTLSRQFAP